jgi:hypothetical protein
MSLGLRFALLPLLIAGCASQALVVPDSDWQTVPAAQRTSIDHQHEADLAAARTELTAASASLAELRRSPPPPAASTAPKPAPTAPKPAAGGDEWATALRAHERAKVEAIAQIEANKAAWQRADLTWRQLRVDAAKARIEMIVSERELIRAQAIDHNMVGNDTYNVAPLRGQFSKAQQRWHNVANAAKEAHEVFMRASATLSTNKDAYAQLLRNGPGSTSTQQASAPDEQPPQLLLTGWAISRSDIRRRRGLRHFLDAGEAPQLRGVTMQLTAKREVQAISPGANPATAPAGNGKPASEQPRSNAPAPAPDAATKPAERPVSQTSTDAGVAINGKPPTSSAATKPAERPAPQTNAAAAGPTSSKPPAGPPPVTPSTTAAAKPPADPSPVTPSTTAAKPPAGPPATSSAAAGPTSSKPPAGPQPANPPAAIKPPAGPPSPPSAAAGGPTSSKPPAGPPSPPSTPRGNTP